MNILLTGATGFVGSEVLEGLLRRGYQVKAASRSVLKASSSVSAVKIQGIDQSTCWREALENTDVVIHSAARVHVMQEQSQDPLSAFRKVNTQGTLNLARQALNQGVKRFIFISSIKVNGEGRNLPYRYDDIAQPKDPYGISKYEAEEGLKALANSGAMEVVIIRPVLVYGPCVKANFLTMMKCLDKSIPLPLGAIDNRRSLVSLANLVDLIVTCVDHPNAASQVFLVSDDEDVSTTGLLHALARALDKKAMLLPLPSRWIRQCAKAVGKSDFADRLCGSLAVDIEHTKKTLNWHPPYSLMHSLQATAKAYQESLK